MTPRTRYSEDAEALVLLALTLVPGMGSRRIHQFLALLEGHGYARSRLIHDTVAAFYRQVPEAAVRFEGVMEALTDKALQEAQRWLNHSLRSGIKVVHLQDPAYPERLRRYLEASAPPLLFLYGEPSLLNQDGCAVVGTRSPSKGGIDAARRATNLLAGADLSLVSGGAVGVDRAAHDAAVLAEGSTVVFLPQGIEGYPIPGTWRKALDDGRLLLASEYLPDAPWQTYAAVSRNALIAAQALLVCVVEPRKQGGSILTARHAVKQGKPVLVEPADALPATLSSHTLPLSMLETYVTRIKSGEPISLSSLPKQSNLF